MDTLKSPDDDSRLECALDRLVIISEALDSWKDDEPEAVLEEVKKSILDMGLTLSDKMSIRNLLDILSQKDYEVNGHRFMFDLPNLPLTSDPD